MFARKSEADESAVLRTIARNASKALADGLTSRTREIELLAASTTLWKDGLGAERVIQTISRTQALTPYSAWIGVVSPDGVVQASTGKLLLGANVAERPWFQEGLRGTHVGDVHAAKLLAALLPKGSDGGPQRFVDFAAPIKREGQLIGVLGMHGSWEWTRSVVESLFPDDAVARRLEVFVLDAKDQVIYASDANFDRSVANQAVTYLYCEEEWIRGVVQDWKEGRLRDSGAEMLFMDRVFANEMDFLVETTCAEFSRMCFRDGIHRCWFDMMIIRDLYRDWAVRCGIPMHAALVLRFVEVVAVMMQPICPHWAEQVWEILGKDGSVCDARWPAFQPYRRTLRKEYIFFRDFLKSIRLASIKLKVASPKAVNIFLATVYEPKKIQVLLYLQSVIQADGGFPADIIKQLKAFLESRPDLKADTKTLMQFGSFMKDEALERGADALAVELPFNQKAILEENSNYLTKVLDLATIVTHNVEDGEVAGEKKKMDLAVPGKPSFNFYTAK
eukprot:gene27413-36056_t